MALRKYWVTLLAKELKRPLLMRLRCQRISLNNGGKNFGVSYSNIITFMISLETRTSGSQEIWQLLRNACIEDNNTAQALIEAADL